MNKTSSIVLAVVALAIIIGLIFYGSRDKAVSPVVIDESANGPIVSTITDPAPRPAGKPEIISSSKVSVSDTTAIVTGQIIPNGAFTNYWYEYGTTTNMDKKISNQSVGSGFTTISAPGYITGLSKNTNYYFRLVAENQYGRVVGTQYSFQTSQGNPAPVGGMPKATTVSADAVSKTTADLNGQVNPSSASTQYWFEYGQTVNLGSVTPIFQAGDGSSNISVSRTLSGLAPDTVYYFRINSQNQFGTVSGAILNFRTSSPATVAVPTVMTKNAREITNSSANINGSVNPNGAETTYWFEYSTDSLLGNVLLQNTTKKTISVDSGVTPVEADLSGLSARTNYYYRIVAQNSQGIVRGSLLSFKTK